MRPPFRDADYPARPYPGARPDGSFVHLDGLGHPIGPGRTVAGRTLDAWLSERGSSEERFPVLAYGSNACPAKITWLRAEYGLAGPVVVLRARFEGLAAVWAAGLRMVDEQRPATLAAMPGTREVHAVWLATSAQLAVLDVCEGRGTRYELAHVHTGTVTPDGESVVAQPLAYLGLAEVRMPLLVDGWMVRCADVAQHRAAGLVGRPAATDGLDRTPVPIAHPSQRRARTLD